VSEHERGSLFLKVRREEAERNIWAAFKYMVNHIFEMYGIEVSHAVSDLEGMLTGTTV